MKITILILMTILSLTNQLHSQSIQRSVIGSSGKVFSNATYKLNFTVGEAIVKKMSGSGLSLNNGFHQNFNLTMTINVKAFLQGYYQGSGIMENVLYTQGVVSFDGNLCDSVTVQLRQAAPPYNIVHQSKTTMLTDGTFSITGSAPLGQDYYIVIKHRNTVETWSANPITLTSINNYDFTTAASKAFGNNQVLVAPNTWALYSGDILQDENVDLLDAGVLDTDIDGFLSGYYATDMNGDGNVDLLDAPILETNINGFVFAIHP